MIGRAGRRFYQFEGGRTRGTVRAGVVLAALALASCSGTAPPADPLPAWPVLRYEPKPILRYRPIPASLEGAAALHGGADERDGSAEPLPAPRIVKARHRLQCVPFARNASGVALRGNAWQWWRAAKGRYRRGEGPAVGAVMVFKANRRSRGHLAVVTRVLSAREIVVDHANWLNHGRIHLHTPVLDISPDNDWSVVRVWYTPGERYGSHGYRVKGFIYPELMTAER